jgi:hypothetical protein
MKGTRVIILFTSHAPHPLAADLEAAGHTVYEALALTEVLALIESHPDAQIVITPDVDASRMKEIQKRYPTIVLH